MNIITAMLAHMLIYMGGYPNWYVGVTSDPQNRRRQHGVSTSASWIIFDARSEVAAREIEKYFHSLGCDGAPGGGDIFSKYVYTYKKEPGTNP